MSSRYRDGPLEQLAEPQLNVAFIMMPTGSGISEEDSVEDALQNSRSNAPEIDCRAEDGGRVRWTEKETTLLSVCLFAIMMKAHKKPCGAGSRINFKQAHYKTVVAFIRESGGRPFSAKQCQQKYARIQKEHTAAVRLLKAWIVSGR